MYEKKETTDYFKSINLKEITQRNIKKIAQRYRDSSIIQRLLREIQRVSPEFWSSLPGDDVQRTRTEFPYKRRIQTNQQARTFGPIYLMRLHRVDTILLSGLLAYSNFAPHISSCTFFLIIILFPIFMPVLFTTRM